MPDPTTSVAVVEHGRKGGLVAIDHARVAPVEELPDLIGRASARQQAAQQLGLMGVSALWSVAADVARERIVEANPPKPEGGPGRGKTVAAGDSFPSVRQWRSDAKGLTTEKREELRRDAVKNAQPITRAVIRSAAKGNPHVSQASGEPEWYTPEWLIEAAREVLGGRIDIDPASNETAQRTVKAVDYRTQDRDGLGPDPWLRPGALGTCWINPPYDAKRVAAFADRLLVEIDANSVGAALWLSNNATDTRWARALVQRCSCFAVLHGRVRFHQPGRDTAAPLQGQMLVGFGVGQERLRAALESESATVWGYPCPP